MSLAVNVMGVAHPVPASAASLAPRCGRQAGRTGAVGGHSVVRAPCAPALRRLRMPLSAHQPALPGAVLRRAVSHPAASRESLSHPPSPVARLPPQASRLALPPASHGSLRRRSRLQQAARAVAAPPLSAPASGAFDADGSTQRLLSGLNGKALRNLPVSSYPSMPDVLRAIPKHCFEKDTSKSLFYAALSTAMTLACALLAATYLPLTLAWTPAWIAYALVTGTVATGCWVVAHECGHGAFSDNKLLQDAVGYALHSALLVPYFSWQRSHAVHHARTNHIEEGETHVPMRGDKPDGQFMFSLKERLGERLFGLVNLVAVLGFGWPVYLLTGASGGPVRGQTNHFWPYSGAEGRHALFPGKWASKVLLSDIGIVAVLAALGAWAFSAGSLWPVLALYVAPLLVTNAWLVAYTWLQHTDVDVPHFGGDDWSPVKGSLATIDRPYGPLFDFLHHRIGSSHVAHHVNHTIPHYHAKEATEALKAAFPEHYLYDPTPVHVALWRVVTKCTAVVQRPTGEWVFQATRS